MKKISIVVPVYNAEKYIKDNLNRLNSLDNKRIEVIIVDDGSTDNSKSIINELIGKKNNFKYIYQKNSGAPTARNNGIKNSSGDYILFLDADDYLVDGIIDKYIEMIDREEYDLIISNYKKVDENGNYIEDVRTFNCNTSILDFESYESLFLKSPVPGNKLYNKKIIDKNKLYFDDVKIGQDLNFYIKFLGLSNKILFINDFSYCYRIVNNGISKTYNRRILDIIKSINYIEKFYQDNKLDDKLNKYVTFTRFIHLYYQFCKIRYIKDKIERKEIYKKIKYNYRMTKVDKKTCLYKKNRFLFYKIKIRFLIGYIYTTNLYHNIFISTRK